MQEVAIIRNSYHAQAQRVAKILGPSKNKTFEECVDHWEKAMASLRLPTESLEDEYTTLDGKFIALGEEKKRVDEDLAHAIKQLGEREGEIDTLKGKIARDYRDMAELQAAFSQLKLSSEKTISALEAQLTHERAVCQKQITLACHVVVINFVEANNLLHPIFDGEEVQGAEEEIVGEEQEVNEEGVECGFSGYSDIYHIGKDFLDVEVLSGGEDRSISLPLADAASESFVEVRTGDVAASLRQDGVDAPQP